MKIYGVALLAACFLIGKLLGNLLGILINIDGDVGGVGFAMIFLMLSNGWMQERGWMVKESQRGILFWSSMYIPIVVAMAATQNIKAAVSGGPMALLVGIAVTAFCFMLVPLLSKIGRKELSEKERN